VSDDSLSVSFAQLRLANIRERHFSDGLFSEMGLVNSSRNPFQARFARSHVAFLQKSSTVISPFLQQVRATPPHICAILNWCFIVANVVHAS